MSKEFLTWAGLKLSPLATAQLHDSFELCALVLGEEVWDVAEQPYYQVDTGDTNESINFIYASAVRFLTKSITRCGVQLREDIEVESISALNSILRTLIELSGDFQLSAAAVTISLKEISNNEKFVELVELVESWIDPEDILALLIEVPNSLLNNIFDMAKQASGYNAEQDIETLDNGIDEAAILRVTNLIPGESQVVDYYRQSGVMGYEFKQYASVFGGYISELEDDTLAAANIALLWLYTKEPTEGYKEHTGHAIDVMFEDPNRAANVGRMVNRLLSGV